MTTLSLAWRIRPGRENVGSFGGSQTVRQYMDFVIGERSLYTFLEIFSLKPADAEAER